MQLIPLKSVSSQELSIPLGGQNCGIKVYQRRTGLYVDLYVDTFQIVRGIIAQNLNRIVRFAYLGFKGDLIFVDSQGSQDPDESGLANRYEFLYLTADDLATLALAAEQQFAMGVSGGTVRGPSAATAGTTWENGILKLAYGGTGRNLSLDTDDSLYTKEGQQLVQATELDGGTF